jgi:hypothetical protein
MVRFWKIVSVYAQPVLDYVTFGWAGLVVFVPSRLKLEFSRSPHPFRLTHLVTERKNA